MPTRVDLADGQWAIVRDVLTHGQTKEMQRAYLRGAQDPTEFPDTYTAAIRAYVVEWHVRTPDGAECPLTSPDDAAAPAVEELVERHLITRWRGRADPNGTAPASPDTSRA